MSFNEPVQQKGGFYEFPRMGYKPLKVTDLRDPRIQKSN